MAIVRQCSSTSAGSVHVALEETYGNERATFCGHTDAVRALAPNVSVRGGKGGRRVCVCVRVCGWGEGRACVAFFVFPKFFQ